MKNVTLYQREGKKGIALCLNYVLNGKRQQQPTGLYLQHGKDTKTRQLNKETLICAKHLVFEKQRQLTDGIIIPSAVKRQRTDFFQYFEEYMELYPSKERRNSSTLQKLRDFWGQPTLPLTEVTEKILRRFKNYLEDNLTGETPYDYFKALKKVIKAATKDSLFIKNPAEDVTVSRRSGIPKNNLTTEEIKLLYDTPCPNETVKRAFLFSCFAGLRYGDMIKLKWQNITTDFKVEITQSKTNHYLCVPLRERAIEMAGDRKEADALVFLLPTSNGTNKSLKIWAERAGLAKKITYHCARHSFACNLYNSGSDVLAASLALGHTNIKTAMVYVKPNSKTISDAIFKMDTF